MTRLAMWMVAVLAVGCATKPSEEDCRKAISNMQMLMGTENLRDDEGIESEVRRCKGGSSKKAVACAIKAQTLDDLRTCDFFKVPANAKGIGPDPAGSAAPAGSAGSAAPAATGSAAPTGSAGSAAPAGSAGSAAPAGSAGSAAPAGSAGSAGSAAPTGSATPTGSAAQAAGSAAP